MSDTLTEVAAVPGSELGTPAIVTRGLTKRFGAIMAVDDLHLEVRPGHVTGFLGPNGAGKSTTLRMILGLVRPTSGTASVLGMPYPSLDHPARAVGAVLETQSFHPGRTGRNHLRVLATAAGIPDRRVDEVLHEVGLDDAGGRAAGKYSLGMRQRLGLAGALLGEPRVLILDEPANGLDPQGIRWLRDFLRAFARRGNAVLVSSHLLAEMSQMADEVIVIHRGRLVRHAAVHELTAGSATLHVRTARDDDLARDVSAAGGFATARPGGGLAVTGLTAERVGTIAFDAGIVVFELRGEEASLEDVFLQMTETAETPTKEVAR